MFCPIPEPKRSPRKKRFYGRVTVLLALLALALAGGCEESDPTDDWPDEWASLENDVLTQLNDFRAGVHDCGAGDVGPVGALTMDPALQRAARLHAKDMADHNYFSHTSLDGRSFTDRIDEAGYTGGCPCGENIAAGNATATATMSQWIGSQGHCENMMGSGFTRVGIGYAYGASSQYGHYWVQVFAD